MEVIKEDMSAHLMSILPQLITQVCVFVQCRAPDTVHIA